MHDMQLAVVPARWTLVGFHSVALSLGGCTCAQTALPMQHFDDEPAALPHTPLDALISPVPNVHASDDLPFEWRSGDDGHPWHSDSPRAHTCEQDSEALSQAALHGCLRPDYDSPMQDSCAGSNHSHSDSSANGPSFFFHQQQEDSAAPPSLMSPQQESIMLSNLQVPVKHICLPPPPSSNTSSTVFPLTKRNYVRTTSRACVSCRASKMSCGVQRPCPRCAKAGRECVDRSEHEIFEGKQRKKRQRKANVSPSLPLDNTTAAAAIAAVAMDAISALSQVSRGCTTAAQAHIIHHNSSLGNHSVNGERGSGNSPSRNSFSSYSSTEIYNASTEAVPRPLPPYGRLRGSAEHFSGLLLHEVQSHGHISMLFELYKVIQEQPAVQQLARSLQWRTNLEIYLVWTTELLLPADSVTLLTTGLSACTLQSVEWIRSPFARYAQPALRTVHTELALEHMPLEAHPGDLRALLLGCSESDVTVSKSEVAPQMLVEWMPAALCIFAQLDKLDSQREQLVEQMRRQKQAAPALPPAQLKTINQSSITSTHSSLPSGVSDVVTRHLLHLATVPATTSASAAELLHEPPSGDAVEDLLTAHFRSFVVDTRAEVAGSSGEADESAIGVKSNDSSTLRHAVWCPAHASACRSLPLSPFRTDIESISIPHIDHGLMECQCSFSHQLPVRVLINQSFERVFAEMVIGWQRERAHSMRYLLPISDWASFCHHLSCQRIAPLQMLQRIAQLCLSGISVDEALKSSADALLAGHANYIGNILTRRGDVLPAKKCLLSSVSARQPLGRHFGGCSFTMHDRSKSAAVGFVQSFVLLKQTE